jgi:hypothetical protein
MTRLPASSRQIRRDAGRDAVVGNQRRLLPAPDARHQGCDLAGKLCKLPRTHPRRMGKGRYRAALTRRVSACSMSVMPTIATISCSGIGDGVKDQITIPGHHHPSFQMTNATVSDTEISLIVSQGIRKHPPGTAERNHWSVVKASPPCSPIVGK